MKLRRVAAFALSLLVSLVCGAPAYAKHVAPTAPGHYREWGPDIDEIDISKSFHLSAYERVVIEPFATDGVSLPATDDNAYGPVRSAIVSFTELFAQGIATTSPKPAITGSAASASAHALRLRGKVLVLDPGSRAKRYWGGFGAGAARVEIHGELLDAASGEVLLAFTQQRRSGFGGFGGSYEELIARTIHQVGEDVGNLLKQF